MSNKITLMVFGLCMFVGTSTFAQKSVFDQVNKTVPAFIAHEKAVYDTGNDQAQTAPDDVTALPLDAVVLWGGPGDPDGEFDGGLNNWETSGVGGNMTMALWEWDAEGDASTGAYWGGLGPIQSPSVANGAAVFNSDFLDNDGTPGNFGNGPSPTPHNSELISPVIDLTGQTNVALSFFSYYRNFQSDVYVSFSNDGGTTWEENIPLHEDIPVNERTFPGEEMLVYLPGSGGTDQFRFKFIFAGDYYFWIIDDVAVIEQPRHDLVLEDFFYTPFSYAQPKGQIDYDEFFFTFYISNPGSQPQTNVNLAIQIFDPSDNLIYEDALVIDELTAGVVDSTFSLDNTYLPADLDFGTYRMEYAISADSTDQWDRDNAQGKPFRVTDNLYQAELGDPDLNDATSVQFLPAWQVGTEYLTGTDFLGQPYAVNTITFGPADLSDDASLNGKSVIVALLEVTEDWDAGDNINYLSDPNLIPVGLQGITFTNEPNEGLITTALENQLEPGEPIFLKEGTTYLVLVDYPEEMGTVFNEFDYGRNRGQFLAYNGSWFSGFTGSDLVPIMRVNIGIFNSTDENPLPESAMNVYPNPVGDQLSVDFELETNTRASLTISDVNGKLLFDQQFENLGNGTQLFDTSDYPNGVYFIRLGTAEGTRTIKFVVQK